MYMPDPWHDPAMASLSNFFLEALEPVRGCTDVMACNYDEHAAIDDGNCHLPQRGEDCRGTQTGSTDGSGTTTFVRAGQQMQLNPCKQQTQTWGDSVDDSESLTGFGNGCFHAVVTLPQDFVLSFEITPHNTQEQWAGITHFTSTGDNCCAYGDRIPGIWFFPGSTKLCVADGQPSDGNDYYTHEQPLPLNRPSRIRLDILRTTVTLVINDVVVWHEARTDRARFPHAHVFAPDPWYVPALATISDFKMQAQ